MITRDAAFSLFRCRRFVHFDKRGDLCQKLLHITAVHLAICDDAGIIFAHACRYLMPAFAYVTRPHVDTPARADRFISGARCRRRHAKQRYSETGVNDCPGGRISPALLMSGPHILLLSFDE